MAFGQRPWIPLGGEKGPLPLLGAGMTVPNDDVFTQVRTASVSYAFPGLMDFAAAWIAVRMRV